MLASMLPIGISFYTFQAMSYMVDIYRGDAKPARSLIDYACFVALFPALDGRADHPLPHDRRPVRRPRAHGRAVLLRRGALHPGLGQEDPAGQPDGRGGRRGLRRRLAGRLDAWFGVLAYAFQIYFDFCRLLGHGRGAGRHAGLRVHEELRRPLPGREHHRSLAAVAHLALHVPPRLPLHPAGRQPQRARAAPT